MENVYFVLGIVTILSIISFIVSIVVIFMVINKYLKFKEKVRETFNSLKNEINETQQSTLYELQNLNNDITQRFTSVYNTFNEHDNTICMVDNRISDVDGELKRLIDSRLDKLENNIKTNTDKRFTEIEHFINKK